MKKKIIKTCAVFMACLTLSLSMFNAYTVSVQASALSVTTEWIIDKVLAKCGIVANASSLSEIKNVLFTDLDSCFANYISWCDANSKDWKDGASYDEWFATNGGNAILNKLVEVRRNSAETDAKTRKFSDDEVIDVLLPDHGGGGRERTISKDIGQPIVDAYKIWWEDCGGYYLWEIPSYKDISLDYYYSQGQFDNVGRLLETNPDKLLSFYLNGTQASVTVCNFGVSDCLIAYNWPYYLSDGTYYYNATPYSQWVKQTFGQMCFNAPNLGSAGWYLPTTYDEDIYLYANGNTQFSINLYGNHQANKWIGVLSYERRVIKVWKSLDGYKAYSVGGQQVYYSPSYTTVVNNDVTISNDYITTYANQYSYNIVQNEIDNSTDITEETVNNIVDNSVTNITNNYYYTSSVPDSDGTTSGGDSDTDDSLNGGNYDGLFDGLLGNLLSLLTKIIEFVVKLFVNGLELITAGFSSIMDLINGLTNSVGDLGGLISSFFPFVPEEIISMMTATIAILCGIAIYRALRG